MALPAHALPLPPRAPAARLFSQPPTIQQTTSSYGLALQIPHHDPSLPRDSARAGAQGNATWPSNMALLPLVPWHASLRIDFLTLTPPLANAPCGLLSDSRLRIELTTPGACSSCEPGIWGVRRA